MPNFRTIETEAELETIRNLAQRGVSETDIAFCFGMAFKTWKRIKESNPAVMEALQEARQIEESTLVGVLYEAATKDKNLTAAMFLLKARHGYQEGRELASATQVNVQIQLPGSMSEDQYLKSLEEVTKDGKKS